MRPNTGYLYFSLKSQFSGFFLISAIIFFLDNFQTHLTEMIFFLSISHTYLDTNKILNSQF
jgi:hypothetical protein